MRKLRVGLPKQQSIIVRCLSGAWLLLLHRVGLINSLIQVNLVYMEGIVL